MNSIENRGSYLYYEGDQPYQYEVLKNLVYELKDACREADCHKVIVDLRKMPGKVSTIDRYKLGIEVADEFRGIAKCALVYRPEEINRFAETVGINRGANVRTFSDIEKAFQWLDIGTGQSDQEDA